MGRDTARPGAPSQMVHKSWAELRFESPENVKCQFDGRALRGAQKRSHAVVMARHEVIRATAPVRAILLQGARKTGDVHGRSGREVIAQRIYADQTVRRADGMPVQVFRSQALARQHPPRSEERRVGKE